MWTQRYLAEAHAGDLSQEPSKFQSQFGWLWKYGAAELFVHQGAFERIKNCPRLPGIGGQPMGVQLASVLKASGKDLTFSVDDGLVVVTTREMVGKYSKFEVGNAKLGPELSWVNSAMYGGGGISFYHQSLDDVFRSIKQNSGVPISADWDALSAAGVGPDAMVTASVMHIPLARGLALILSELPSTRPLGFRLNEMGVVEVSTREKLEAIERSRIGTMAWCMTAGVGAMAVLLATRVWWRRFQGKWVLAAVVAVIVLGGRIWFAAERELEAVVGSRRLTLAAVHGQILMWGTPADPAAPFMNGKAVGVVAAAPDETRIFDRGGFKFRSAGWPFETWVVGFPLWTVVLASLLLPAMWVRSFAWRANGKCCECGYDLTGNTSGVCPECGAAANAGNQ